VRRLRSLQSKDSASRAIRQRLPPSVSSSWPSSPAPLLKDEQSVTKGGDLIKGTDAYKGILRHSISHFIPLIQIFNKIKNIVGKYITI
jgi:hypothetical protein